MSYVSNLTDASFQSRFRGIFDRHRNSRSINEDGVVNILDLVLVADEIGRNNPQ